MQLRKCYNCMEDFDIDIDDICPHCGYYQKEQYEDAEKAIALKPGTLLDEYYIGRVLGIGGFAITYVAYDYARKCKVAIKEYFPKRWATREPGSNLVFCTNRDDSEQFMMGLNQFEKESRQLAKVGNHPGIVNIFKVFPENETEYIAMEFVDGVSLEEVLTANGPMNYSELLKIMIPICSALDSIHANEKIIHRDIAPDNIMLQSNGRAKLIDFGASLSVAQTNENIILKHGYAPIEQYDVDASCSSYTDVYAMCAVIYHMLTGKRPPRSDERKDAVDCGNADLLLYPSQLGCILPEKLEAVIMKGLSIQPQDRIQTAGALAKSLLEFVPDFTIPVPVNDPLDKKKLLKTVLAVSVPLVAVLIVLAVVFLRPSTNVIKDYSVIPNLSGMTLKEAQKTVDQMKKELGISFTISEKNPVESDDKGASGTVAMQSPKAGSKISSEDVSNGNGIVIAVNLYEYNENADSSDDRKIEMPALEGKSQQKAEKMLKDSGLYNFDVETVYDETVEAGKVISQSAQKGSSVKASTKIVLLVSKGPKPTTTKPVTTKPSTTKPTAPRTTKPTQNQTNNADRFQDIPDTPKPSTTKPTTTKPTTTKPPATKPNPGGFEDIGDDFGAFENLD